MIYLQPNFRLRVRQTATALTKRNHFDLIAAARHLIRAHPDCGIAPMPAVSRDNFTITSPALERRSVSTSTGRRKRMSRIHNNNCTRSASASDANSLAWASAAPASCAESAPTNLAKTSTPPAWANCTRQFDRVVQHKTDSSRPRVWPVLARAIKPTSFFAPPHRRSPPRRPKNPGVKRSSKILQAGVPADDISRPWGTPPSRRHKAWLCRATTPFRAALILLSKKLNSFHPVITIHYNPRKPITITTI